MRLRRVICAIVLSFCGLWVSGCSSKGSGSAGGAGGSGGGDCSAACNHVQECGGSAAECMTICSALSDACLDAMETASCADLQSSNGATANICFPPCSGSTITCNGDVASGCSNGHQITVPCADVCASKGGTYSGVCASSYQGQSCSNGSQCCWCQL